MYASSFHIRIICTKYATNHMGIKRSCYRLVVMEFEIIVTSGDVLFYRFKRVAEIWRVLFV